MPLPYGGGGNERGTRTAGGCVQGSGGVRVVPIDKEQVRLLEQRLRGIGVDRRTFMKIAGAALAAPAAGSLLAACGGDDDDAPAPTNTTASGSADAAATTGESAASPSAGRDAESTATSGTAGV